MIADIELHRLLLVLKASFQQIFANQFERMLLFGSRARGDAQPDSDIDVLDAEDLRHTGDYDIGVSLTATQVNATLAWATEFLAMAQQFFSHRPGISDV